MKLLNRQPSYGYELIGRLRALGPLAAGENTVYPLLRRLKKDGILETYSIASPAGPPRQNYCLTNHGQSHLETLTRDWKAVVIAVEMISGDGDG